MVSIKRGFLLLWCVAILTRCIGGQHASCEGHDHYCIHGICVESTPQDHHSHHCACHPGYYGEQCELRVCSTNPCQHGGTCQATSVRTYHCACRPGYLGDHCEVSVDGCLSKPCQNGGTCKSLSGGAYTCSCWLGYTGTNCEEDQCNHNPCKNGGTCEPMSDGSIGCACPTSYTGPYCEVHDACNSNPCLNGGLCLDQPSGSLPYTCVCQSEYFGANCELKPVCNPNPCLNGGICIKQPPRDQAYACYCQSGYTGNKCENGPTTTPSILSITTLLAKPATTYPPPTTVKPVTSTITLQYGAACDKLTIINDIVSQRTAFSLDGPKCPSGTYTSPEAFVIKHCLTLGNPSLWRRGSNVWQSCKSNTTPPVYTPIGTFSGTQYNSAYSWAAIFLGCETDGFKVGIQMCDGSPNILHVRQGNTGFHADPSEYYWIVA